MTTSQQATELVNSFTPASDPAFDLYSKETTDFLEKAPVLIAHLVRELADKQAAVNLLNQQIVDTGQALADYANETGAGVMMMDGIKLCMEQVRIRRGQK